MRVVEKLQACVELHRLEDRYIVRKDRNVWRSDAQYVNGEYVYACRDSVESSTTRTSKTSKPSSSASSSVRSSSATTQSRDSSNSTSSSTSKWSLGSGLMPKKPNLRSERR